MSGGEHYNSLSERISWTTGFRCLTDKHVLEMLATFASFKPPTIGQVRRDLSLEMLINRAHLPRRTVIRSLRRLEDDRWIRVKRQHRHHTVYDIAMEKLAPHWMEAKLVSNLSATGGTQTPDLSATDGTQFTNSLSATGDRLNAVGGTQTPGLGATGGTPSPVRTDPLTPQSAPALRAGVLPIDRRTTGTLFAIVEAKVPEPHGPIALPDWGDAESEGSDAAPESSAADADLRADGGDRTRRPAAAEAGGGFWGARRAHQAATSRAGVPLPERSDSSRPARADRSGARVGSQPTLGPLDVSAAPVASHWQRLADTFRAALQEKANTTTPPTTKPSTQRKSG
jgi:hypothetical protein